MKTRQKGFTLIELLLVVSLLSISVGVTNDILISLIRTNNKTQVMNEIEQQSSFVSLKIEKELRNASLVYTPLAGGSGTILNFRTRNGVIIEYELDQTLGILKRGVNGATKVNVTSNFNPGGVVVTCGETGCFSVSGYNPQIINTHLLFNQSQLSPSISYSGSLEINSTVVIRNTY